jgi:hypothetical protein
MKLLLSLLLLVTFNCYAVNCDALPKKIKSCSKFSCIDLMEVPGHGKVPILDISIEGLKKGKCVYVSKTLGKTGSIVTRCKVSKKHLADHSKLFKYTIDMRSGELSKIQDAIKDIKKIGKKPGIKEECKITDQS